MGVRLGNTGVRRVAGPQGCGGRMPFYEGVDDEEIQRTNMNKGKQRTPMEHYPHYLLEHLEGKMLTCFQRQTTGPQSRD